MKIAENTGLLQKDVGKIVQMLIDSLTDEIAAGNTIELRNFGVFEVKVSKSRVGRNPHAPEKDIVIPARKVAKFRPGKDLKARVEKLNPRDI